MKDTSSNTADDNSRPSASAWLLFPLALFPLAALLTYDSRVYTELPPPPSTNWIGALGDFFAHYGYALFGLAIWILPVLSVVGAVAYLTGRRYHFCRRTLALLLILTTSACLVQVIAVPGSPADVLTRQINIADAGGAVGYLLMTRCLSPLLSNFGSSVLMAISLLIAIVLFIGANALGAALLGVGRWMVGGHFRAPSDPEAARAEEERRAEERRLAEAAREEVKRQKEEEKARIRAEKEAARAAKRAEKEVASEPPPEVPPSTRLSSAQRATEPRPTPEEDSPADDKGPYLLPPISLLNPLKKSTVDHGDVNELARKLTDTLKLFGIDATLAYTVQGPVVTKYALNLAPGTRYSAATSLSDNLMGALHARSLRIEAPIPGEECIGIEVPNRTPAGITFREIVESEDWRHFKGELPLLFGKDAAGKILIADLAAMPHMLVAGATGQGKSVCLNAIINGLLMTKTPAQLKLIMVDPKSVEFAAYATLPHLIVPVITENKKVVFSLHWAVAEMEKRLKLFSRLHVKNIYDFNHRPNLTQTDMFGEETALQSDVPKTLPYIVIIIDEAADLIGQCGKEVNPDIQRITQKARAAGIHLILATQRPDAKIITGTIKANIPGRVAFKTATAIDSRTILDDTGAENLIGKGDMLYKGKDNVLVRAQGAWISDPEIANITTFIEEHANTDFDDRFTKKLSTIKEEEVDLFADDDETAETAEQEAKAAKEQVKADENATDFKKAVECIINTNRASTSHFQRRLGWGYNHSAKIMDMLEDAGVIGPQIGAGPRAIIMDQQQLMAVFNGDANAAESAAGETDAAGAGTPDIFDETKTLEETI